jgi:chemotaxis signal transduction protein
MQLSTFYIKEESFAVPSLVVEEYFRPLPITKVPGSDRRIDGIVNIRGRTAVVVNMRQCFDVISRPSNEPGEMILLETTQGLVAEARELGLYTFEEPVVLSVDSVSHIHQLTDEEMHPAPPHVNQSFVDGVVQIDGNYYTMISIKKLIDALLNGTVKETTC